MIDRLDRAIRVGDVLSFAWFDHGTTYRVIAIDKDVLLVKRCYRGRKILSIRFPTSCRCDARIVNR